MAFWGIELKPGKAYVHRYEDDQGRLHLSQVTLGSGTSTKKTIVQCKVGDRKPIFLCSLLPEKLENCALNLEFEEEEEVTFSVIGPHSVHLSGFFFGETEDDGNLDLFEGQACESGSESDDPLDYDSEDDDEDDFIDDDDDIDMYPSSPIRNSGVKIEEIVDDEKPTKENAISKQSKKKQKNQKGEPNKSENSGKQLVVRGTSGAPVLESEDEDGFPISFPSKKKTDDLPSRSSDATKDEHTSEEDHQKKDKNDFGHDKSLKRKIDVVEQDGDPLRDIGGGSDHGAHISVSAPGNDSKQKKKNKKEKVANKDDNHETGDVINGKGSTSKEANSADMEQMPVAEMVNGLKSATNKDKETEKKKKKKKNEKVVASDADKPIRDKSGSPLELGEKAETKPSQVRTFPNGLVIEELAMGKPNGKRATPGKKVSVHYIGKLKKNSKIFDSNIGKAPFKFRLGIGQVIKGWDVGVNGMRVGDKRRLTIPPAMGYGAQGAGGAIPPNSWLVFDVELVDVS